MTDSNPTGTRAEVWPSLPLEEWRDTYATLHMWTQIVGKIRLAQSPPVNHWWQVETSGFVLPYDDVRRADDPDGLLIEFLQSTYEAGANLAKWDRAAVERTLKSVPSAR